jgi:hypothetical protein
VVDRQFVENIPLNGRSFQSLMTMVPGVLAVASSGPGQSGEISVNGQRTEANYFTVDGVSANTGASLRTGAGWGAGYSGNVAGETALGTTQSMVSIDALQEFRATTSTYSAEYGRTPGGQFSFTTRSGSNDWHGSLFDYFRNDVLDANNWFSNYTGTPKPAERQNNFGGTLGGPLLLPGIYNGKDKTFFFFSYEGLRLRIPQSGLVTDVPTLALRQQAPAALQPYLNAFPLPNGADEGNGLAQFNSGYSSPSSVDAINLRLDRNFSDRFKAFGRFSNTPSNTDARSIAVLSQVNSSSVGSRSLTLGTTNILTPSLNNQFRFNVTESKTRENDYMDNFGGATPFRIQDVPGLPGSNPEFMVYLLFGLRPWILLNPNASDQYQVNITDTFGTTIGRHSLKWGVDYRRLRNSASLPSVYQWTFFNNAASVLANQPANISMFSFSLPRIKPVYTNFSAFISDEWKATQRLSLSLGLRWDVNPAPKDASGNDPYTIDQINNLATANLAPPGTPLWHTTYRNFGPRLGAAYQARQTPGFETVLRGGFGVFYDTGNTQGSQGYWGVGYKTYSNFTNVSFPLTQAQLNSIPAPNAVPPYTTYAVAFDPHLKLPYTLHWNFSIEQALGTQQTLTMSYVGSTSRRLLVNFNHYPDKLGNPYFASSDTTNSELILTTNRAESNYNALQVQFQRRLSRGLQALVSYTWSHSLDDASTNFDVSELLRASSDFDVRHNLQAAVTYNFDRRFNNSFASHLLRQWAVDVKISARSSLPVDIIGSENKDPSSGLYRTFHPNLVADQPLYINDSSAPGGRRINYNAFSLAGPLQEGNLGRNALRGFNAIQTDLSLHRDFSLTERVRLQFRAEAFNLFNHPIFGSIYNQFSQGANYFGRANNTQNSQLGGLNSLYQVGGPRSLQLALKLHF